MINDRTQRNADLQDRKKSASQLTL